MSKSDEQIEKESDRKQRAATRKGAYATKGTPGIVADWTGVDSTLVTRLAAAIGRDGGAVRLGYTRDGGAYAIGLYNGDDRQTVYVSPNDDIDGELRRMCEYYET